MAIDEAKGLLTQDTNGSYRYQMKADDSRNLSNMLGNRKLSDALKTGGKARMTIGGDADEVFQDLEQKHYQRNSEQELGFHAVSKTGRQHLRNSEIQDDSLVTVGKNQARAIDLYNASVLSKDAEGNYILPSSAIDSKKN